MLNVMTHTLTSPRRATILDRLATEWRHITMRAADLATVRRWGLPGGEINTLDDVLIRAGYVPYSPSSTPSSAAHRSATRPSGTEGEAHDAYLLRLLTLARHDPLAARIVLQRILPALCAIARRHAPSHAAQQDLLDELIGNAWAAIRRYPVERRPRSVVPNLVRDIGFQTIVRPMRRRSASERPMTHDALLDTEAITILEPLEELITLLNEARTRGISAADIDLICQIVTLNRPENVADVHHVTPRTVRNRRDAVVHRLRDIATAA